MTDKSPVSIRGFDHVTMIVRDLQATAHFYGDLLGLASIDRPAFDFAGSWFQAGQIQLHFIEVNDLSGPSAGSMPAGERVTRSHHVAFCVDDWQQTIDRLKANGIAIAAGPKTRPDGAHQVYISDPDGHLIELCCER